MKHLLLSALLITGCSQAGEERKPICGINHCEYYYVSDDTKHLTLHKWTKTYDSLCAVRDTSDMSLDERVIVAKKCTFWIEKIVQLHSYNKY